MSLAEDFGSPEDFESEEIGVTLKTCIFMQRIMKHEDFCFRSFIFSFLSHRKHHTIKGGRGNIKETDFQVMLISKSYTYPILSSEAIGNLISVQSNFFSDRDEDLLVSKEFVLTKELGIRQCGLPTQ